MTYLVIIGIIALAVLMGVYFYRLHLAKLEDYAEAVRISVKARGGQDVSVQKIDTPYLTGAVLFTVNYLDVEGRRIVNKVTMLTSGEDKFKTFWGDPLTPLG
ncbi:MAG: hypothetical protein AAGD96_17240 [Chloroflexota bacterium]